MQYKNFTVISLLLLSSCTKEINIDLNSSDAKIVIEGNISNEVGPYYVKLSKSVNFSESNIYPPISNAIVVISDNVGTIDTLIEEVSGTYKTQKTIGVPGNTYNLTVFIDGNKYTATSKMPIPVKLDSLKFGSFSGFGGDDSTYTVIPVFRDPESYGNNYRFIQTVDGELDKSYIIFNDNATNGIVNQRPIFSSDVDVRKNSEVKVEMRCVDPETYLYFYSLSQIAGNGPGGGTTPSNPPTNITGDVMGIFSAYSTQTITQIAP